MKKKKQIKYSLPRTMKEIIDFTDGFSEELRGAIVNICRAGVESIPALESGEIETSEYVDAYDEGLDRAIALIKQEKDRFKRSITVRKETKSVDISTGSVITKIMQQKKCTAAVALEMIKSNTEPVSGKVNLSAMGIEI